MDVSQFLAISLCSVFGCASQNGGTAKKISCNLMNTEYHMLNVHPFAMKNIRHIVPFWIVWIRSLFSHLNTFSFREIEKRRKENTRFLPFAVCSEYCKWLRSTGHCYYLIRYVWDVRCESRVYLNQFWFWSARPRTRNIGIHQHRADTHVTRTHGSSGW